MLGYCLQALERLISKAVIVKNNGDSKLLLFYLIFGGGSKDACFNCTLGQLLYTVEKDCRLQCFIVGGGIRSGGAAFSSNF